MTTTGMLIIIGIVAIIAVGLIARSSRPRVTQIDRTVRKDKDSTDA